MHHAKELARVGKQLRDLGYRLTPQRLMILEVVTAGKGHVTAEGIHGQVVEQYPDISLSTVYRTLETLRDLGLVTQTDLGAGREEYHFAEQALHHHLICRRCGSVAELDNAFFGPLAEELLNECGFRAEMTHFAVFGVCAACSSEAAKREADSLREKAASI